MPTELILRRARRPWPGQGFAHVAVMIAAVAAVWLARRLVALAKRLDTEL